jgi:3-isopropylmalate dehydrogenase
LGFAQAKGDNQMKKYKIAVIKGDGIGPEIVDEAIKVLDAVSVNSDCEFSYKEYLMGGNAYDIIGNPLPQETIDGCKAADAVLFGAIGGEQWDTLPRDKRPESGLLRLRSELELYANFRPVIVYDELIDASTLKREVVEGVDLLVMRELTGGLYFGEPREKGENRAYNTMVYTKSEIVRIAREGFESAMNEQRERARAAGKFDTDYTDKLDIASATDFSGYDKTEDNASIEAIFVKGEKSE